MHRTLFSKLFQTRLAAKIWFCMAVPAVIILLLTAAGMELFLHQYFVKTTRETALMDTDYVYTAFSSEYNRILERFVSYTSSSHFKAPLRQLRTGGAEHYTDLNNTLQDILTWYGDMSSLIDSSLIAARDGCFYYSHKYRMKNHEMSFTLGYDPASLSGITLLPSTESPFIKEKQVMPLTLLLKYSKDDMILLSDTPEESDFILYLFLDSVKVTNYLRVFCNDNSEGILYLSDPSGKNLSLWGESASPGAMAAVQSAVSTGKQYIQEKDSLYLIKKIDGQDLYLVNILPAGHLTAQLRELDFALFLLALICIILTTCLSLLLSVFVTAPLKRLMASVRLMEEDRYEKPASIKSDDEIGRLNSSMDSMYRTIKEQIETIKQEEHEKTEAQIRLLTEQINPHFLYNTLEGINMEVYNGHNETASSMISSLGEYLRLSLSYGDSVVPLMKELEQVQAYIHIMNFRFHHNIVLHVSVEQGLEQQRILKSILQPLIENCIKHGFSIDTDNNFPILPEICVEARSEGEYLILEISDNGAGIDVERAESIMKDCKTDASDRHFGLGNIYKRLNSFYQEASVSFRSIPYFENKVTLRLRM